jgi:hypothetical protein
MKAVVSVVVVVDSMQAHLFTRLAEGVGAEQDDDVIAAKKGKA